MLLQMTVLFFFELCSISSYKYIMIYLSILLSVDMVCFHILVTMNRADGNILTPAFSRHASCLSWKLRRHGFLELQRRHTFSFRFYCLTFPQSFCNNVYSHQRDMRSHLLHIFAQTSYYGTSHRCSSLRSQED